MLKVFIHYSKCKNFQHECLKHHKTQLIYGIAGMDPKVNLSGFCAKFGYSFKVIT